MTVTDSERFQNFVAKGQSKKHQAWNLATETVFPDEKTFFHLSRPQNLRVFPQWEIEIKHFVRRTICHLLRIKLARQDNSFSYCE